jgi:cytidine deaminase
MNAEIEQLLTAAQAARARAYAPYSHFHVGAAIRTRNGHIFSGCNVENTSYGLTNCAERTAIFKMVSEGERQIDAILVIGDSEDFLPPCGACRQVIAEFSSPHTPVCMCNTHGLWQQTTVGELIPHTFFLNRES